MKILKRICQLYKRYFWSPIKYAERLGVTIGEGCSLATYFWGSEPYLITIGNNVQVTDGVKFFTHGGGWVLRKKNPTFDSFGKIKIGNNVYIGNNSLIMPGITIGDNVVIGAGTIVTKSIPENAVVVGNPAMILYDINIYEKKCLRKNVNTKKLNYNDKKQFLMSLEDSKFISKEHLTFKTHQ